MLTDEELRAIAADYAKAQCEDGWVLEIHMIRRPLGAWVTLHHPGGLDIDLSPYEMPPPFFVDRTDGLVIQPRDAIPRTIRTLCEWAEAGDRDLSGIADASSPHFEELVHLLLKGAHPRFETL